MSAAFFPISVSNNLFASSRYIQCLQAAYAQGIDHFTFLIADQLQLYNYAIDRPISEVIVRSITALHYGERTKWINRVAEVLSRSQPGGAAPFQFEVVAVKDMLDATFFGVYRGLRILYDTNLSFRFDVIASARQYADARLDSSDYDVRVALSSDYIIEEIALNIRVRVSKKLTAEYYPGKFHEPLTKLYKGGYGVTYSDLMGGASSGETYNFFSYSDAEKTWREI